MPYEIRLSYDAKLNDEYEDFDSWHRAVSDFVMDKAKGHHPSTPIARPSCPTKEPHTL